MPYGTVQGTDLAVTDAPADERERQNDTLTMVANENHVNEAIMETQSSGLTNNYTEGYPGSRYYGGCEYADEVEQPAIDHIKELWGVEHASIQPHSGSQANIGVFPAVLNPGDKTLSLDLTHDGHLSHGHPVNVAGKTYEAGRYEVSAETGYVGYDQLAAKAKASDPDIIISGYSAYPREVERECAQAATDSADAHHLVNIVHITGLVVAGKHSSSVGTAGFVTGSTHKTIRSGRGGIIMRDEERVDDVNSAVFPGLQGEPILYNVTGKAIGSGEALTPEFEEYASQVVDNAAALDEWLQERGLELISEGADTCLALIDLRPSHPGTTGKDVEAALEEVGIVLNTNTAPGKSRSAFSLSGIRTGTPALTTRGLGGEACRAVADFIYEIAGTLHDESVEEFVNQKVDELTVEYPPYGRPAIGSIRLGLNIFSMRLRPDSEG